GAVGKEWEKIPPFSTFHWPTSRGSLQIGKSALFTVAMSENEEKKELAILIRPDDIISIQPDITNLLTAIRDWKLGLEKIICEKVFINAGIDNNDWQDKAANIGGKLINFITNSFKSAQQTISLEPFQKALVSSFIENHKIIIYIDDLDRGWQARNSDIFRISALLNAARDMANTYKGLQFKISLRSDVYFLVRTSDESTDKIENSVIWHKWENIDILAMLVKRVETYFGNKVDESRLNNLNQVQLAGYLEKIFTAKFQGFGKWHNASTDVVLMSMIRKRPRDLVKICAMSAQVAYSDKSNIIKTHHLQSVFEQYSQNRIQDTVNEYGSELPDIKRLLLNMKPKKSFQKKYVYNTSELTIAINNIIQGGKFIFANNKRAATPKELAQFLFKINFITARKDHIDGRIERKYFEESRYLSSDFVDFGYEWEIHPAFRWALEPSSTMEDIFNKLDLTTF
ncbi:hypothetical protein H8B15_15075, partial [Hymenobacter sp. BT507]